jgi:hypothetical protein
LTEGDYFDFFAVQILADAVYGTPVFHTFGGQSCCPGEPGTSLREGGVEIYDIEHRCGPNANEPCIDTVLTAADTAALFAIVIQNLSPTQDAPTYILRTKTAEGPWNAACGASGRMGGLAIAPYNDQHVNTAFYPRLPYGMSEIYTSVSRGDDGTCYEYKDIEIQFFSNCEFAGEAQYQICQYKCKEDDGDAAASGSDSGDTSADQDTPPACIIDYKAGCREVLGDTKAFSVAWSSSGMTEVQSLRAELAAMETRMTSAMLYARESSSADGTTGSAATQVGAFVLAIGCVVAFGVVAGGRRTRRGYKAVAEMEALSPAYGAV